MEYKVPLWQHQLATIERANTEDEFGLLWDPGTGKTATTINILRHKFNDRKRFLKTLIFTPPVVLKNWRQEWLTHSKVTPEQIVILTGSQKQRVKTFLQTSANSPKIYVTNYEALLMGDLFKEFERWVPEAIVWDESHRCKDPKTKRTKAAIVLSDLARYKYILSGTPVLNSHMDLFAQFRILDGGETFGKNFFGFRAEYFYDKNAGMPKQRYFPDWRIRPGAVERINAKLFKKCTRVVKEECMDLPPMVKKTIEVGMLPEQARMYEDMRKNLVAYMKDKACVAQLALTKALRLMQITSGFAKMDDGSEIRFKGNPKQEALKELLEELTPGHKVIVWAVFKENYAQIKEVCEELKIQYVEVHGEISNAGKFEAVDRFKSDPSVRVFLGHPGSGGIGINLVAASYSIVYSRTFSLEQDIQAEARNYRGGSKEAGHAKITRISVVTSNTIEIEVVKRLANKEQIGESLLHDLVGEL